MIQSSLFQALDEVKAAVAADVEAAGGCKKVALALFAELVEKHKGDTTAAIQKVSNSCNPKQKAEFDKDQMFQVALMARSVSGRSHIFAHYAKLLDCELHWVTPQEKAERTAIKLIDAARSLQQTILEAQEVLRGIK